MDNLTHTLIGTLVGETIARTSAPDERGLPAKTRRNVLVSLAAIGSNLPDADLLYSFFGGKVNYLLHHRGHTHTVIGALALAAAVYALTLWWLRRCKLQPSTTDRLWMCAILLIAPLLHIGMDATNNYGVHPFWPLYNGWLYGDSVFIAEPLLWAACAPLAFLLRTLIARVLVLVLLAVGVALAFFSGLVPLPIAIVFTVLTVVMLIVGHKAPPRAALAAGICVWLGATVMFIAAGQSARRQIDEVAANMFPQARLLDRILTPMPANPFCWETLLVQTQDDEIALRRAMLSLAPTLIGADGCLSRSLDIPTTAQLKTVKASDSAQLKWYGEILTPRDRLTRVITSDCVAAAAMRFVRAPWLAEIDGHLVLGDLRYDREKALGFAEIELHQPEDTCPSLIPPWLPPRADLLR
jgi:inner membrane protein